MVHLIYLNVGGAHRMNRQILKLSTLLALASPLCAYAITETKNTSNPPSDMKKHEMHMQQMRDMNEITPSAEPSVCGCVTPFVTADFISWRAQEDGLDFSFNGTSIAGVEAGFLPETASRGTVKSPHFSYEPGFKVGAGLKFEHDGWDLFAQYTWWRKNTGKHNSKSSLTEKSNGSSYVIATSPLHSAAFAEGELGVGGQGSGLATPAVQKASATWALHFNVLDAELGRNFWISKYLTLRPFIGMKFSWLTQH